MGSECNTKVYIKRYKILTSTPQRLALLFLYFLHWCLIICLLNPKSCFFILQPHLPTREVLNRIKNSYKSSALLSLSDMPSTLAVTEIPKQLEGEESAFSNTMVTSRCVTSRPVSYRKQIAHLPHSLKMKARG